jgi:hypothetical protein
MQAVACGTPRAGGSWLPAQGPARQPRLRRRRRLPGGHRELRVAAGGRCSRASRRGARPTAARRAPGWRRTPRPPRSA